MPDPPLWAESARADLLRIDQASALGILRSIAQYLETKQGDVRRLTGRWSGYKRLRVGPWRVLFLEAPGGRMEIRHVRNRSEAYR
ncbi:MAG: type II toxin-antitoxin system RelE/ParE family toxin [Acidobacteria bacterium]|nr:type II toxin-antitoxin system RelE/ParE family toxin [Acidobacteriota bacterium]